MKIIPCIRHLTTPFSQSHEWFYVEVSIVRNGNATGRPITSGTVLHEIKQNPGTSTREREQIVV